MKLKAILDNLDSVDDALKAAYTEKDGKFHLNVEGYDPNEIDVLRSTMRRAKDEKKAAETKLSELQERYSGLPEDFSVEEYNTLKDSSGGKIDQRLTEQRNRLTADKEAAVKKLTDERDKFKARVESLASENEISKALAEANITSPYMQKAVRAMFKDQVKVEYEEDGKAVVTIESLPVVDKIKAWAGTEEGKYFVQAPGNGGGGSGGGSGGTGKSYDKMTSTELVLIQDTDPRAKAEMDKRSKVPTTR